MAASEPRRLGVSIELKPHAYDPIANPELFEGVVARRIVAFLIDFLILSLPVVFVSMFIFVVGVVTFGLGFLFYGLLWPGMVIWALAYYGLTLGGAASATIGMRVMDIEMRTWYGAPAYFVLGAVHAVVFWITVSMITPLVLLVCLFNERRRCLHDILVGTVVINSQARAASLRASRRPAVMRRRPCPFDAAGFAGDSIAAEVPVHVTQHSRDAPQFYLTAPSPCPYLAGREERKVFTHLVGERAPGLNDLLTHGGFRRSQSIAYRPACDGCRACVSVRVIANDFRPSRNMRRVAERNADIVGDMRALVPTSEQYSVFRAYLGLRAIATLAAWPT